MERIAGDWKRVDMKDLCKTITGIVYAKRRGLNCVVKLTYGGISGEQIIVGFFQMPIENRWKWLERAAIDISNEMHACGHYGVIAD